MLDQATIRRMLAGFKGSNSSPLNCSVDDRRILKEALEHFIEAREDGNLADIHSDLDKASNKIRLMLRIVDKIDAIIEGREFLNTGKKVVDGEEYILSDANLLLSCIGDDERTLGRLVVEYVVAGYK